MVSAQWNRASVFLLALLVWGGYAGGAWAERAPALRVGLSWTRGTGAEACIADEELRTALSAQVGEQVLVVAPEAAADRLVVGSVAREGSRWLIQLQQAQASQEGDGARTLEVAHPDCREIDEAVVLVLSLLVQPWLATHAASATEQAVAPATYSPEPSPERAAEQDDAPTVPEPYESPRRTALSTAVGGVVGVGIFPDVALGVNATLGWRLHPRLALEVSGSLLPHLTDRVAGGGQVAYRAGQAELHACGAALTGKVLVDACLTGALGAVHAEASGFVGRALARRRPWMGLGVAVRAALTLRRGLFVRASASASRPLRRDRFIARIDDETIVLHQMSAVVFGAGLELGWSTR